MAFPENEGIHNHSCLTPPPPPPKKKKKKKKKKPVFNSSSQIIPAYTSSNIMHILIAFSLQCAKSCMHKSQNILYNTHDNVSAFRLSPLQSSYKPTTPCSRNESALCQVQSIYVYHTQIKLGRNWTGHHFELALD